MRAWWLGALTLIVALAGWDGSRAAGADDVLTIGTAQRGGIYYPVGDAICRLVNAGRGEHGPRCLAAPSEGSVANIEAIRAGQWQYAIVQSDVLQAAFAGTGTFAKAGALTTLRAVLSLQPETFTLITRAGSGIRTTADIRGRRLNLGLVGSGTRATALDMIGALGLSAQDFGWQGDLSPDDQVAALCHDQIDVATLIVSHPSGWVQQMTDVCDARLLPVDGAAIKRLIKTVPYYAPEVVPGRTYRNQPEDIPTFGVRAVLVTSSARSDAEVYALVKAVLEGLATFRRLHPALGRLEPKEMATSAITVPRHPGAERYLLETGLL